MYRILFFILLFTFGLSACQSQSAAKMTKHSNQLIHESSPYLLQHAHNPVDWYPWGDMAWDKAKKENKLVVCKHWLFGMSLVSCDGARIV
jgi:hypothetical protein